MRALVGTTALACALLAVGCGTSSGPVLERVEPRVPPEANLRADVLLVRRVDSCAIGTPCDSRDPDDRFYLSAAWLMRPAPPALSVCPLRPLICIVRRSRRLTASPAFRPRLLV